MAATRLLTQPLSDACVLSAQAASLPKHSLERLLKMAAFAISIYSTIQRTQKPFKNLQNSTYELVYPEKGLRAIGEKVRLHPRCMHAARATRVPRANGTAAMHMHAQLSPVWQWPIAISFTSSSVPCNQRKHAH